MGWSVLGGGGRLVAAGRRRRGPRAPRTRRRRAGAAPRGAAGRRRDPTRRRAGPARALGKGCGGSRPARRGRPLPPPPPRHALFPVSDPLPAPPPPPGLVLAVGLLKKGFDVVVLERDLTAIRGEGKYRGPIQVQSNALAALQALDAEVADAVLSLGVMTGDRINGLCDGLTGDW